MSVSQIRLDSLDFATQLGAVRSALEGATTRITFWGTRVVEIRGNSYTLETLVGRVLEAGRKRCDADDLTLRERVDGIEIESKLKQFYQLTDAQIPHLNWLTWILIRIREFSFIPYTPRFYLEDTSSSFQLFSPVRYYLQFGRPSQDDHNTPEVRGRCRFIAERDAIYTAAGAGG